MKVKICGLFREADIDYVNETRPDFIGFVFAPSRRQVTASRAAALRKRLARGIIPVGVFVNAPLEDIAALQESGVIEMVQLHGNEDAGYMQALKALCGLPLIKAVKISAGCLAKPDCGADYVLFDSGAGSGP
jgi:phosphoribosylanthranilate isomerase